jgi:hypothetical protein
MKYECIKCNYVTDKKSNYEKHLTTRKHLSSDFQCETCKNTYKTKSGLWKHHCTKTQQTLCELLMKQQEENIKHQNELLNHIKEQQQQIKEMMPKIGNTQQININIFLNEECKDALNWNEFLNTLDIKSYDISTDITDHVIDTLKTGIKQLGMYMRPIHCIDKKKMCIKNENKWIHDIQKVQETLYETNIFIQQKYMQVLKQWEIDHPMWHLSELETDNYTQLTSKIWDKIDNDKCNIELMKSVPI